MITLLLACTSAPDTDSGPALIDGILLPDVATAVWVESVDNPYYPLPEGAEWHYEAALDGGSTETIDVNVEPGRRDVNGVSATVVYDVVKVDGVIAEETWDWYAQDQDGNVWYLGEDTCEWVDGACAVHAGAWEWGVDGALPGWIMPADPAVDGQPYFQEYYEGEAEDVGEVIAVGEAIEVAAGSYSDCIRTADTSHLDPDLQEEKVFCPGIGNVYVLEPDATEELITHGGLTPGV